MTNEGKTRVEAIKQYEELLDSVRKRISKLMSPECYQVRLERIEYARKHPPSNATINLLLCNDENHSLLVGDVYELVVEEQIQQVKNN